MHCFWNSVSSNYIYVQSVIIIISTQLIFYFATEQYAFEGVSLIVILIDYYNHCQCECNTVLFSIVLVYKAMLFKSCNIILFVFFELVVTHQH